MRNGRSSFGQSLTLANECVQPAELTQAFEADDPLHLNLPPLLTPALIPSAGVLRTMAALYLQAEVEQAGVISVAEWFAKSRLTLEIRSTALDRKLHTFTERTRRDWYDRESRSMTFARVFGLGMAASLHEGRAINNDFQPRFATLCSALLYHQQDYIRAQKPGASREVVLREAATSLLFNLGSRQYGNLASAARLIQEQLNASIEILNDPHLAALFQVRGIWEVLRKVLGTGTPDLGRLITRGQAGLQLLLWLASVIPALSEPFRGQPLLPSNSQTYTFAASWLAASGIDASALGSTHARR